MEACIQFEGLFQPIDNLLKGLPIWSILEENYTQQSQMDSQHIQHAKVWLDE
jgi:hypothetical protein